MLSRCVSHSVLAAVASIAFANATQAADVITDPDGTTQLSNLKVPVSDGLSVEAQAMWRARTAFPLAPVDLTVPDIKVVRNSAEEIYKRLADRLRQQYPVTIEMQTFGGVHTGVVMPKNGIASRNRERVLINAHGGGFFVGAGSGGLVESIPIAAVARIRVVTVDYRMAPEHRYPAASEDIAAVYRALLKDYKSRNIGIYGCSVGGMLAAQSIPYLRNVNLPAPGAIGMVGAGAAYHKRGDSLHIVYPLLNRPKLGHVPHVSYLNEIDMSDPMVSPAADLGILAKFPPTLFINATRDPSLSNALFTHSQMVKAGAETELHVWEGLWHCFVFDDIPEARDAYDVIARFFDKHLGAR